VAAPPTVVPCEPWTDDASVRACCPGLDPLFDLTDAITFATEILYRLSGRQFPGECERIIYPCKGDNCGCAGGINYWAIMSGSDWIWGFVPGPGSLPAYPIPTGDGSGFLNCKVQGSCQSACKLDCLDLPGTINEIVEVVIDGEVIPPTNYKIKAYRELCWVGSYTDRFGNTRTSWPCSNNLGGISGVNTDRVDEAAVDATGGQWRITVTVLADDGLPLTEFVDVLSTDSAAAVQAAIEGMSFIVPGDVTVTGGPGDAGATTPYVFTWDVEMLEQVPVVAFTDVSLVGGGAVVTQTVTNAGFLADPGTWSITYNYGKPVTEGGRFVAAKFACQIALAMCGGDGCVLPQRLKSISRQGVDMLFADPLEFLDNFQTGIYEVDMWLASVNPNKLQRRARVFRADKPQNNNTFTG
jgi:hypothetical protein